MNRRGFLRAAAQTGFVAALAPTALAACGSNSAADTSPAGDNSLGDLRIGYLPITDASPLLVAHASGALSKQGFNAADPTLFRGWADIVEAFQADRLDAVHLLMPLAIQLRFGAELPIKVVAWNHTNGSALTVSNDVHQVSDLAGGTIAVPFWWSVHNVVVQQLLRANELTPIISGTPDAATGTAKLVILPPPDMVPALASGSISGFIVADPFNALAEVRDAGHVLRFTGDVWRDHACCVTVVSESFVNERGGAAQGLVNALAASQLQITRDRPAAAALLSDGGYLPQPVEALERALDHYALDSYGASGAIQHPEWESDRIGFQPYAFPSYTDALVEALGDTLIDGDTSFLNNLAPGSTHSALVADGLAQAAIEANGGPTAFGLSGFERSEEVAP